jgi:hypothetical protein
MQNIEKEPSKMKCLINQPAGLGDIIFCQKIVDMFINNGYEVIWPVVQEYHSTVNKHMKKNNLLFPRIDEEFSFKEYYNSKVIVPSHISDNNMYLPLRYVDLRFPNQSVMKAKYKILNLDYNGWQDHFIFERDSKKEDILYYEILGLKDNSKYTLLNRKYGSPPHYKEKMINVSSEDNVVEMDFYKDFTIFDWCKVLEKAAEIYTVDTAINYILEKLNVKDTKLHLYSRFTDCGGAPDWSHIEGLFLKEWIYYNE